MSTMLLKVIVFFIVASWSYAAEGGKFINPVTDVCWSCIFPITVSGANITPQHKGFNKTKSTICACAGTPPKVGIPITFWEPVALIDVTRIPYKLLAWGGASLSTAGTKKRGTISHIGEGGRSSFYNVHYYKFPLLHWLGVLGGFPCLEAEEMSLAYLSEFDPCWGDSEWTAVLNPESLLFANPLAQVACIPDCIANSLDKPQDELFWCAGCSGSLYPLTGHVAHHVGNIQASYLLVSRVLSKLHSMGTLAGFNKEEFCRKTLMPRLKKSIYKTQLVAPIASTKGPCQPLGKSDITWGSGKSYPNGGEDFVYMIWGKNQCCLDAIKAAMKMSTGDISP